MAQNNVNSSNRTERQGPPMPQFLFKLANPMMKMMLNSPFHGQMSERLMVLSFTGCKTGKHYSTPVGYVRQDSQIFVFTHSAWRFNFQQPAPVRMRIQGKDVQGIGQLVNDPGRIKQMIQALTYANGEEMSRRMGFWVENLDTAEPETIQKATQRTYFIDINIENRK
jgi:hypothetical protein